MSNVAEFTYEMQVNALAKKNRISYHKAKTFIKEYRLFLKDNLYNGNKIIVEGLVEMYPSIRQSVKEVFDVVYDYDLQVKDLCEKLKMEPFEVHHLLRSYLSILIMKLEMGYSIKISGVFLLKPEDFGNGNLGYVTRLSPSLEKPDSITLKVERLYGTIDELQIEHNRIIYRLNINDKLKKPKRIRALDDEIEKRIVRLDNSFLG